MDDLPTIVEAMGKEMPPEPTTFKHCGTVEPEEEPYDDSGDEDNCGDMDVSMMRRGHETMTRERRRVLVQLALEAADWIAASGIQSHELCLFRRTVETLVDTRHN